MTGLYGSFRRSDLPEGEPRPDQGDPRESRDPEVDSRERQRRRSRDLAGRGDETLRAAALARG
jgi:hypothetical protein